MWNTLKRTQLLARRTWLIFLIGGITLAMGLWHLAETTAWAAPITFVVISIGDGADVNLGDGICDGNPLPAVECTLRAAIQEANSNPGQDSIHFAIGGPAGVKTIFPASPLPSISSSVIIDGYTQPGASQNTLADGNNAVLLVALDGSNAGSFANGLNITGSLVSVRGLVINSFTGSGIRLAGNQGGSIITGNRIGTNALGNGDLGNLIGVRIENSSGNTIGGLVPATRNLIAGSDQYGVLITGVGSTNNAVIGNFIGTNAPGTSALGNMQGGVFINDASLNLIGGMTVGARNVISGNLSSGVTISGNTASGNKVQGNLIGTKANGIEALGNLNGVFLFAPGNLVGGIAPAPGTAPGNVISGNTNRGISIGPDAAGNTVQGNLIGADASGAAALGNKDGMVVLQPDTLVGGTAAGARNVISGNTEEGFIIAGSSMNSKVQGNFIGTNAAGTVALGNGKNGVIIQGGVHNNLIGGTEAGARNVISGNEEQGIRIQEPLTTENVIQGNFIGTDSSGVAELRNKANGVFIDDAPGNVIGGSEAGARNVISGNGFHGVRINGSNGSGNKVEGNYIGIDVAGTVALGNGVSACCVLSGVTITSAPDNFIGGTTSGAGNVISGHLSGFGIDIFGAGATGNRIQGNLIGTNAAGTAALGNIAGIEINTGDNIIGGTTPTARNVISGNNTHGIRIGGNAATGNKVQGNFIGTDVTGTGALGNNSDGVLFSSAANNQVGGDGGARNTIAFNKKGVFVQSGAGTGNFILSNSIHSNSELGIDLQLTGVLSNDVGDGDSGPNNLQNFPVLTSATNSSGATLLSGTLNSTLNTSFRIELFSNPACDPSGNGEGHKLIDTAAVTTDANGNASITGTALTSILSGPFITATATDADGNTSEFSQCIQLSPGIGTVQFGETTYSVFEDCTEVILSVSRAGDTSNAASVDYETQSATANDRTDFTTARGTLRFEAGETAKSFVVLITEDSRVEGTETATIMLSNASGATLVSPSSATLEILDDPPEPSVNTIDISEQFAGHHYHDFLNRQHDTAGLNFWTNQIEQCEGDAICIAIKRINVSAAFFLSIEFQETGGDVIRTQRAAFGKKSDSSATRIPYIQFIKDSRQVGENVVLGQVGWEQKLEANRQAYAEQVVGSSEFVTKYPLSMTADQYVDALFATAMVVPTSVERQDSINAFGAGDIAGRTAALRKVADSSSLRTAEFRAAFVLMEYFGYLRRDPDESGYQFWLAKLNQFNGDFVQAEMVRAFISSTEYRERFGQP